MRFIAPSAGLNCKGLPEAFSNLSALQALDISGNTLLDTPQHVAEVCARAQLGRRRCLAAALWPRGPEAQEQRLA